MKIKNIEIPVMFVCLSLTLAIITGFKHFEGDTGTENPHTGLDDKILTSWEHASAQRFPQPNIIRESWKETNYRSSFDRNIDRPITSKVTPVMVNPQSFGYRTRHAMDTSVEPPHYPGTDEDLLAAHYLLEEYQLEFFPTPLRANGRKYKFNKLFNLEDVAQWRMHHGARWVADIDDIGRPTRFVAIKRDAPELCVVGYDTRGRPYSFSREDLTGNCKPEKIKWKPENYSIFLDAREDGGLAFGSHIANLNYTKHGFVRSGTGNSVSLEVGKYPEEKPTLVFHQNKGLIDFDERYVEVNKDGDRFLRVRHVTKKDSYGPIRYIPILTKEEAGL